MTEEDSEMMVLMDPDLKSDTEVTVIFRRSLESVCSKLTAMDEHIVKLQSGMQGSHMESGSDSAPIRMCLRELFNITKGTYFSKIHDELIRSVRLMLPQEMRDAVNINTTFSLISSIYEDMLKKVRNF